MLPVIYPDLRASIVRIDIGCNDIRPPLGKQIRQRLRTATDGETTWTLQIEDTIGFADFEVSMDLLVFTTQARTGIWTVDYGRSLFARRPLRPVRGQGAIHETVGRDDSTRNTQLSQGLLDVFGGLLSR